MPFPRIFGKPSAAKVKTDSRRRFYPRLESLESRMVLHTVSGNSWPSSQLVTISFMPDGTDLGGATSNLFTKFNAKFGSTAAWQNQILKGAQVWAKNTNLNFAIVSDNGQPAGSGAYQQGDPGFGDIRIGGHNFGTSTLAQAYSPPPINNYSTAGDITFNTGQSFNIGSTYDLFTVAAHEFGHALGLLHSNVSAAVEYPTYQGAKTGIDWDDIYGDRDIYSGGQARAADYHDATGGNNSFGSATDITQHIGANLTLLRENRDITTTADVDFFNITAPAGTGSTVKIAIQSTNLSLLSPKVTVYASNQSTILGSANGAGQYGTTLTVTLTNKVSVGQALYVKVQSADTTPFGTGKYAISASFGGAALPFQAPPNTQLANGTPRSGGGGNALAQAQEYRVNSAANGDQRTSAETRQGISMDARGNHVIVWSSYGQDGDGWGVFGQRYDMFGNPQGSEFQVNVTTAGDQQHASVAMDELGNFVVAWSSNGQDGSGAGVYARRYTALGLSLGGEFRVNSATAGDQTYPVVAMDALGNSVITWSSQEASGWNIYAQRYTILGLPLLGNIRVNATTAGDQVYSHAAINTLGETVVVWSSYAQDGSGWGVYGRRYNVLGLALGGEYKVNTTTTGDQHYPTVAMNNVGDFVVTWSSNGQDGSGWGVYAQVYRNGLKRNGEFRVASATAGDQMHSSVVLNSEGNFLVAFASNGPGTDGWDILGRQFDSSGNAAGSEFIAHSTGVAGDQVNPSIAADDMGHIMLVWSGSGADGQYDVFAQRFVIGAHACKPGGWACPICVNAQAIYVAAKSPFVARIDWNPTATVTRPIELTKECVQTSATFTRYTGSGFETGAEIESTAGMPNADDSDMCCGELRCELTVDSEAWTHEVDQANFALTPVLTHSHLRDGAIDLARPSVNSSFHTNTEWWGLALAFSMVVASVQEAQRRSNDERRSVPLAA